MHLNLGCWSREGKQISAVSLKPQTSTLRDLCFPVQSKKIPQGDHNLSQFKEISVPGLG